MVQKRRGGKKWDAIQSQTLKRGPYSSRKSRKKLAGSKVLKEPTAQLGRVEKKRERKRKKEIQRKGEKK